MVARRVPAVGLEGRAGTPLRAVLAALGKAQQWPYAFCWGMSVVGRKAPAVRLGMRQRASEGVRLSP